MIGTLVSLFLIGLIALIALAILGAVFSIAASLAWFILFKVVPVLLVGYLVVRLFRLGKPRLSEADEKWLEG